MKMYKIWCEWDMGFKDAYSTEAKAQKAIDEADWDLVDMTMEEILEEGLVGIEEVEVD